MNSYFLSLVYTNRLQKAVLCIIKVSHPSQLSRVNSRVTGDDESSRERWMNIHSACMFLKINTALIVGTNKLIEHVTD